jgi:hypothetical protein
MPGRAAGLHPPSAQGRCRPLHRPSAPGRQPASTLRAGTAARIDPSHWGRLAAPALRAGVVDCTGRGCRRHRGGDRRHRRDDAPLPTQQRNARARAPSPASQHPAHHARRDNGRTPRPRWSAKFRQPLRPRQRRSVETTVCAPLRRHSTVVSAVWAGQHCPSPPPVRAHWLERAIARAGQRVRPPAAAPQATGDPREQPPVPRDARKQPLTADSTHPARRQHALTPRDRANRRLCDLTSDAEHNDIY